jgi:hypothetical protein
MLQLTCPINAAIPLLLTLKSKDTQALDLIASEPLLQLTRTLALGTDAMNEAAPRRSNNTFPVAVSRAVFWPYEKDDMQSRDVRVLRGEVYINEGLKPSFSFPRFAIRLSPYIQRCASAPT